MKCYFVRGLSRSGGTLMATILDAHPDVAMSYETYEHLLMPCRTETAFNLHSKIGENKKKILDQIKSSFFSEEKKSASNFTKFVERAKRAGIDQESLGHLFFEHFDQGLKLDSFSDRMRFVERLTKVKMVHEGKRFWGGKIVSIYDELDEMYPDARYLFMLRDGRDIAASRKKVGDFKQTVEHVADTWCKQIKKFENFATKNEGRAVFVPYEQLTLDPETELRRLMEKIDLPWSERLLDFHKLDLSIHRKPTGHLSGKQVKSPINTSSIGRWKTDLTQNEISRFEERAGETLAMLGYL